jgi:inosine-uridine nucleoside N-ribohydrolase
MHDTIPIIFDTDIGSDIDDAVALAYLLRQPRCELVGITTVTGDVAQRAACAQVICDAAGRGDMPIHCGASRVLLTGPGQPKVPQYQAIRHLPHRMDRPTNPGDAIEFMRREIRRRPGEITLLSVGPFTNVALLFAIDPQIPSLLKGLVSMAGLFYLQNHAPEWKNEWNCKVDPIATAISYRDAPRGHLSYGLDVTMKCQMSGEDVRRRFAGPPPLDTVLKLAEVWFGHAKKLTFHDPLAAASIFRPELCEYETGNVAVTIEGNENVTGQTLFTPAADGQHRVARSVNADAFFREYFSVFA